MTVLDLSRKNLPDDTPIYKYIDADTFFKHYLDASQPTLFFRNIHEWLDGHEGLITKMLKALDSKKGITQDTSNTQSHLGSCWALCTDDERLYGSDVELTLANNELVEFGSDAMWQTYCPKGGVRIQTTIGKLRNKLEGFEYLHGLVKYATQKEARSNIKDSALFIKRIPFRHENEYRFIITLPEQTQSLSLRFELMDFVDEFLVSPKKEHTPSSREIYLEICRRDSLAEGSAVKDKRPYRKPSIRISQLYGFVSGERHGA